MKKSNQNHALNLDTSVLLHRLYQGSTWNLNIAVVIVSRPYKGSKTRHQLQKQYSVCYSPLWSFAPVGCGDCPQWLCLLLVLNLLILLEWIVMVMSTLGFSQCWSFYCKASSPPCWRQCSPSIISEGVLVLFVLWVTAGSLQSKSICLVVAHQVPCELLHMLLSMQSSCRSGWFARDGVRVSLTVEKKSRYWARWCTLLIYSSISYLRCVSQHDCWLSRWLYGWRGCKRPLKNTIAGFSSRVLTGPLAGSDCVLLHRQYVF
jgi:hypothetical protein